MVPVVFVLKARSRRAVTTRASVDPIPATMDASYLGNLPVAFASAVEGVPADSGDVLSRHFAVRLLDLPDHARPAWGVRPTTAPVAEARAVSREACVRCTPAERRVCERWTGTSSTRRGRRRRVAAGTRRGGRRARRFDSGAPGRLGQRPPERRRNGEDIRVRTRRLAHRVPRVTGCHVRGAPPSSTRCTPRRRTSTTPPRPLRLPGPTPLPHLN